MSANLCELEPETPAADALHASDEATNTSIEAAPASSAAPEKPRTERKPKPKWYRRKLVWAAVTAAALVVSIGVISNSKATTAAQELEKIETERVARRPMRITLPGKGTLESAKNVELLNEVEWPTKILKLAPEGTLVAKGDVICELDASGVQEQARQYLVHVTRSESGLTQAKESREITRLNNERNIAAAKFTLEMAKVDLEKYEKGEFPQQKRAQEGQVSIAQQTLQQAQANYEFQRRMTLKGYSRQDDLETARLAVVKAKIALDTNEEKLTVLDDFTEVRTMAELETRVEQSERAVQRAIQVADLSMLQMDVSVAAWERSLMIHKAYYARLERNIAACTIRAPSAGRLIYANFNHNSSEPDPIREGADVHYRQQIALVPDLQHMKVDVMVDEAQIGMIKPGLEARLSVDAFSSETFHGRIAEISSMPVSNNRGNEEIKEYVATVEIVDDLSGDDRLKPGLTAKVEIMVDERDSVLQVPVHAVVGVNDTYHAFVMTGAGPESRDVEVGRVSEKAIEIVSGLEEGESVVISPRTRLSEQLAVLEQREMDELLGEFEAYVQAAPSTPASRPEPPIGD